MDLGHHLKKRRMDLGLPERQAAQQIGVHHQTFTRWETNATNPAVRWWPQIIRFLGYDPRPEPANLAERLVRYRTACALSQEDMARQLGVDPTTLRRWESGRRRPEGRSLTKVLTVVSSGLLQPLAESGGG